MYSPPVSIAKNICHDEQEPDVQWGIPQHFEELYNN